MTEQITYVPEEGGFVHWPPEYTTHQAKCNNKLRYRAEHSASIVLSWCTL